MMTVYHGTSPEEPEIELIECWRVVNHDGQHEGKFYTQGSFTWNDYDPLLFFYDDGPRRVAIIEPT